MFMYTILLSKKHKGYIIIKYFNRSCLFQWYLYRCIQQLVGDIRKNIYLQHGNQTVIGKPVSPVAIEIDYKFTHVQRCIGYVQQMLRSWVSLVACVSCSTMVTVFAFFVLCVSVRTNNLRTNGIKLHSIVSSFCSGKHNKTMRYQVKL